jgi:hypothetical protein
LWDGRNEGELEMNKGRIITIAGVAAMIVSPGVNAGGFGAYLGASIGVSPGKVKTTLIEHKTAAVKALLDKAKHETKSKCHPTPDVLLGFEGFIKDRLILGAELHWAKKFGKVKIPYGGYVLVGGITKAGTESASVIQQRLGHGATEANPTDNICVKHKWAVAPLAKIGVLFTDNLSFSVLGGVSINSHEMIYTVDDKVTAAYAADTGTSTYKRETTKLRPALGASVEWRFNKFVGVLLQYRCEFKTKYDLPHELARETVANTHAEGDLNTTTGTHAITNGSGGGNAKSVSCSNNQIFSIGIRFTVPSE